MYPDGPAIRRYGREIQSMQCRVRDVNRRWEGNICPLLDQFSRP